MRNYLLYQSSCTQNAHILFIDIFVISILFQIVCMYLSLYQLFLQLKLKLFEFFFQSEIIEKDQIKQNISNMNQNYKTLKYQISASNLELRHNTQPYTRLILKKNPDDAPMKLLHKRSVKDILPKYLHTNPDVDKEKLLHEIQQQHLKLKRQYSLKKTLQQKLSQKITSHNQPKLDLKNYSRSNSKKNTTMSRTFTSTSSQMHSLAQRSIQNEIKSINNQISALNVEKQKNDDKIFQIKHSQKYIRYVENHEEKLAFLSQLKKMKLNLKNLQLEIRNLKRAHMQKKKLKIQQLLMEGEIENSIQRENIQLYRYIEDIKEQIRNVASKKANMVMKREKLVREIEEMKEMYQIPVEIVEQFYRSVEASKKKWGNYSSLSNSKVSSKKFYLTHQGTLSMKDQDLNKEQDQNQSLSMTPKKAKYRQSFTHIQQQPQQSMMDEPGKQQAYRRAEQQRDTIQQLQKKYFQYEQQKYEQEYQEKEESREEEVVDDDENDEEKYEDDEGFESEEVEEEMNEIQPIEQSEMQKCNQMDENDNRQAKFTNKPSRGVSF